MKGGNNFRAVIAGRELRQHSAEIHLHKIPDGSVASVH